jgi:hypothetical protein
MARVCRMVLVGIAHFALSVVLYYGRVKDVSPVFQSDASVFILPTLLAFGAYSIVAWFGILSAHRFVVKLALTLLIAVLRWRHRPFALLPSLSTCGERELNPEPWPLNPLPRHARPLHRHHRP